MENIIGNFALTVDSGVCAFLRVGVVEFTHGLGVFQIVLEEKTEVVHTVLEIVSRWDHSVAREKRARPRR